MASAYDFSFETLQGKPYPLSQHKGQPLLVVNTASKCGFTPQYAALQGLVKRFPELAIVGVPCNDFGGQEPGSSEEIGSSARPIRRHLPDDEQGAFVGPDAHPFFKWVVDEGRFLAKPRWNFYKYLINKQGELEALSSPSPSRTEKIRQSGGAAVLRLCHCERSEAIHLLRRVRQDRLLRAAPSQ